MFNRLVCLCRAPAGMLAGVEPFACEVLNDRDGSLALLLEHWRRHKGALLAEIAATDPDAAKASDSELGRVLTYYLAEIAPFYPGASAEEKLESLAERLRRVYIEKHSPLELLRFFDSEETLFFVDSPSGSAERMFLDLALSRAEGVFADDKNSLLYHIHEARFPLSRRQVEAA